MRKKGAIRFPDTKSGAQTRVIGQAAVDLLLDQPKTKSPFFFPADWGEGHFIGVVRVLDRICERAKIADVTPHTLRHTFASLAGDLGFSELTIAALLGTPPEASPSAMSISTKRCGWRRIASPRRWLTSSTARRPSSARVGAAAASQASEETAVKALMAHLNRREARADTRCFSLRHCSETSWRVAPLAVRKM